MTKHNIIRISENGSSIVKVELSNRPQTYVIVDASEYDQLIAQGHSGRWRWNTAGNKAYGYVRTSLNLNVARLILSGPSRHVVTYLDGNPLNLRRDNLLLTSRSAKFRVAA